MSDTPTMGEIPDIEIIQGWSGFVLPLGVFASNLDRRIFRAATWMEPPLTLSDNHWSDEMIGPVDHLEIRPMPNGGEGVWASGRFFDSEDGQQAAAQLSFWGKLYVSMEGRDGQVVERLIEDPNIEVDPAIPVDEVPLVLEQDWATVQIAAVAIERGPAFDQAWISPDPVAAAFVPAPPAVAESVQLASAVDRLRAAADPVVVRAAGAGPFVYPAAYFARMEYEGPTRLSISDDGEVTGHVCVWGERYRAPGGGSWVAEPCGDLSEWLVGAARLDDGSTVATGVIVSDGLHGPAHVASASGDVVRDLIESTANQVVQSVAWEDEFGLAVHGSTLPGVTSEQATRAMAGCPSIDQRDLGDGRGFLTMGVLCVNTCGFSPGDAILDMSAGEPVRRLVASSLPESCSCGGSCGTCLGRGVAAGIASVTPTVAQAGADVVAAAIATTREAAAGAAASDTADVGRLARIDARMQRERLAAVVRVPVKPKG